MRIGCVSFVAMYAAVNAPTLPAVLAGRHPNRIPSQNPASTAKKITKYTMTATVPYSANSFWTVFFTERLDRGKTGDARKIVSGAVVPDSPYKTPTGVRPVRLAGVRTWTCRGWCSAFVWYGFC